MFRSKKGSAIAELKSHLNKLGSHQDDEAWETKSRALFQRYLGEDNDLYKKAQQLRLKSFVTLGGSQGSTTKIFDYSTKWTALMEEAISFIELHGLHKINPCKGMVFRAVLWSCIVISFTIGVFVGTWYRAGLWPF
jgi:hypothetical protein